MNLKLDNTKKYAIALGGGGAKGAYQVGAWRAFDEAGIKYAAVSGTSVGALNGAMMAAHKRELAEEMWRGISMDQIVEDDDPALMRLLSGNSGNVDLKTAAKSLADLIKARGLDAGPLRNLLAQVIDEDAVRASDAELYIITYSLTERRELEIRAKDLPEGELNDMLMASSYLPAFRNVPLGGKRYTDGGLTDVLPLHVLFENGYRDIIGIRLFGLGVERKVTIPKDANITIIQPKIKMGHSLLFDSERSAFYMRAGYLDAMRALYGLAGEEYYIDVTLTEKRAYKLLVSAVERYFRDMGSRASLREINEWVLPRLARGLGTEKDYRDVLVSCLEAAAAEKGIEKFEIYGDEQLIDMLVKTGGRTAIIPQMSRLYSECR